MVAYMRDDCNRRFDCIHLRNYIGPVNPTQEKNFISVWPTVYSKASQKRLGAFRKRSSKRRSLKRLLCVLVWTENILKTELFGNDYIKMFMWLFWPSFPEHKFKMPGDCCVPKFLTRNMDEKHLIGFQSKMRFF